MTLSTTSPIPESASLIESLGSFLEYGIPGLCLAILILGFFLCYKVVTEKEFHEGRFHTAIFFTSISLVFLIVYFLGEYCLTTRAVPISMVYGGNIPFAEKKDVDKEDCYVNLAWVNRGEMKRLPLRSNEPVECEVVKGQSITINLDQLIDLLWTYNKQLTDLSVKTSIQANDVGISHDGI